MLENSRTTIQDKLNTLQHVTVADVKTFGRGFLQHCRLDALVHGNVSAQQAYDITTMVWKKTHPTTTTASESATTIITRAPLEKRVVQLVNNNTNNNNDTSSSSSSYLYRFAEFNEANTNSSVEMVLQMGALNDVTNATLSLFNALVKEPAFNQLRTEEQLGYIVHVSVKTNGDNIKGLLLLIQSDSFSPEHVETRMELFIQNYRKTLVEMSDTDFQTFVDATVASFLEKVRRTSCVYTIHSTWTTTVLRYDTTVWFNPITRPILNKSSGSVALFSFSFFLTILFCLFTFYCIMYIYVPLTPPPPPFPYYY